MVLLASDELAQSHCDGFRYSGLGLVSVDVYREHPVLTH
jgi:hypothetical protein